MSGTVVQRPETTPSGIKEPWHVAWPSTALGWVALGLVAAHGTVLVVALALEPGYRHADEIWTAQAVVTAAAFATTAILGGVCAIVATARLAERSLLMLVPVALGAFWLFWLLAGLPDWIG